MSSVTADPVLACSWSGGKDSAFAFYKMVRSGARAGPLITMLTEDGTRSRSHGLHRSVLEAQAAQIGVPLIVRSATWAAYEDAFVDALREAAKSGATGCVFGDIDFDDNRAWEERVSAAAGLTPHIPLWRARRDRYVADLIGNGFRSKVIAVKQDVLPKEILGRVLDPPLVERLAQQGVDLAGEAGEYHTVLISCPLFQSELDLADGDAILRDGVWFLDQRIGGSRPVGTAAG